MELPRNGETAMTDKDSSVCRALKLWIPGFWWPGFVPCLLFLRLIDFRPPHLSFSSVLPHDFFRVLNWKWRGEAATCQGGKKRNLTAAKTEGKKKEESD